MQKLQDSKSAVENKEKKMRLCFFNDKSLYSDAEAIGYSSLSCPLVSRPFVECPFATLPFVETPFDEFLFVKSPFTNSWIVAGLSISITSSLSNKVKIPCDW